MDNSFFSTLPTSEQQMFAFPLSEPVAYDSSSQQVQMQKVPAPATPQQLQFQRLSQTKPAQLRQDHLQQQQLNLQNHNSYNPHWPVSNTSTFSQEHPIINDESAYNSWNDIGSISQTSWPLQQTHNNSINSYASSVKMEPDYASSEQANCVSPLDTPASTLFSSWDASVQIPPTIKEEWPVNNNNTNLSNMTSQQSQQFPIPPFPSDSQQQFMFMSTTSNAHSIFNFQNYDTTLDFSTASSASTTTTSTPSTLNIDTNHFKLPTSSGCTNQQRSALPFNSNFSSLSVDNTAGRMGHNGLSICNNDLHALPPQQQQPLLRHSISREITPPPSITASGSNSPNSSISTPPPLNYLLTSHHPQQQHAQPTINNLNLNAVKLGANANSSSIGTATANTTPAGKGRRGSSNNRRKSDTNTANHRTYRRRASSHPSVASVVSLSAHEPVSRIIDGIEYITFLYSHDRLIKEYTVRTDVHNVNLDAIPDSFRVQNAIYPRANVPREEYDGNRWDYETRCNRLGWEICWLNQEQLCGRRGLIQRAVDSYRNRHAELRSRRVTRQEKVNNGTLRKRSRKKSFVAL